MSEYQTVVLDRCRVPSLKIGGMYPKWVTQNSDASFFDLWRTGKPRCFHGNWHRDADFISTSEFSSVSCALLPEVAEVFRDLPPEQRIARIEYRLKPEPYTDDEPAADPVNSPAHYH